MTSGRPTSSASRVVMSGCPSAARVRTLGSGPRCGTRRPEPDRSPCRRSLGRPRHPAVTAASAAASRPARQLCTRASPRQVADQPVHLGGGRHAELLGEHRAEGVVGAHRLGDVALDEVDPDDGAVRALAQRLGDDRGVGRLDGLAVPPGRRRASPPAPRGRACAAAAPARARAGPSRRTTRGAARPRSPTSGTRCVVDVRPRVEDPLRPLGQLADVDADVPRPGDSAPPETSHQPGGRPCAAATAPSAGCGARSPPAPRARAGRRSPSARAVRRGSGRRPAAARPGAGRRRPPAARRRPDAA